MARNEIPLVLVISATDPTGGAGMATDIRVCQRNGVYPMCCVTAITVQNQNGLTHILPTPPELIRGQLEAAYEATVPDAVKIGLIPTPEAAVAIADVLSAHNQRNVVLDPVLTPTCGGNFMSDRDAVMLAMAERLFPLTELVTPNIPEYDSFNAIAVNGHNVWSRARNILLKGGHDNPESCSCTDLLIRDGQETKRFRSDRIDSDNLHGTGCFLSSAIASRLAADYPLETAINLAKDDLTAEIRNSSHDRLIPGYGPVFTIHRNYNPTDIALL